MRRGVTIVKYEELTSKYPEFIYHNYTVDEQDDGIKVTYHFETVGLTHFYPIWVFPKNGMDTTDETVQEFLFSIGMVELISYWKAACPPHVRVLCGYLSETQKAWWKKLYFHGLGEFFYTNGIETNMDSFMTIDALDESHKRTVSPKADLCGCMVPVGGGKDSIVTLHILSRCSQTDFGCFMMNHRNSAFASAMLAGCRPEDVYRPRRQLDRTIVDLNRQGFLNGHTPLSALIAFAASFAA